MFLPATRTAAPGDSVKGGWAVGVWGRALLVFGGLAWAASIVVGFTVLGRYETTAGAPAELALGMEWPRASRVVRTAGKATLVMLAHPKCACTRASIAELDKLMQRNRERLTAHVLFVRSRDSDWSEADHWNRAARIGGVTVSWDEEGREAALFGAKTSGQTAVFDTGGHLIFQGGITGARGHEGDNVGRGTITNLLSGQVALQNQTSVYGCRLGTDPQ